MTPTRTLLLLALGLLVVPPVTAAPQEEAPAASGEAVRRSYVPADFAQYAPKTALDLLERVPGFAIRAEDSQRGLGEATGNVVVNGERISGKDNDVITAINGEPVFDLAHLRVVLGRHLAGDKVKVTLKRGDESLEVELTLAAGSDAPQPPQQPLRVAPKPPKDEPKKDDPAPPKEEPEKAS